MPTAGTKPSTMNALSFLDKGDPRESGSLASRLAGPNRESRRCCAADVTRTWRLSDSRPQNLRDFCRALLNSQIFTANYLAKTSAGSVHEARSSAGHQTTHFTSTHGGAYGQD